MEEVNIFCNVIEHELHTKGSCIVYCSNSSDRNRYVQVKKQIRPSRYIRAYVHQVALLKKWTYLEYRKHLNHHIYAIINHV